MQVIYAVKIAKNVEDMFPILIKIATLMVLLGLVTMYLSGETALTAQKKQK